MSVEIIYVENDNVLEVSGIANGLTGVALSPDTITVTLVDGTGSEVSGESWPKALARISDGLYRTTLPYTLDLAAFDRVTAIVDIDAGPGLRAHFSIPCVAQDRNG